MACQIRVLSRTLNFDPKNARADQVEKKLMQGVKDMMQEMVGNGFEIISHSNTPFVNAVIVMVTGIRHQH